MSKRRGLRVFWRIYLHGFLILVAVAVTVVATNRLVTPGLPHVQSEMQRGVRYFAHDLGSVAAEPERLQAKLELMSEIFEADVAVYRADGSPVAQAGQAPLEPEEERPQDVRVDHRAGFMYTAAPLGPKAAGMYVVARRPFQTHSTLVVVLLAVLGVMALVTLPLARAIVRPLVRLTATAQALGAGDLSARSGLDRRDEVGTLARAFDDMAARLQRLVRSERELLANISHELKTPMARIRVALELCDPGPTPAGDAAADGASMVVQDVSDGALREHLRGIDGDLAELETLVDEVLAMARLEVAVQAEPPDSASLRMRDVPISELLERSAARFERTYPEHTLRLTLPDDLGQLGVDPVLLHRAIDNVLDNAGKYSDAGGAVELDAQRREGQIVIEVRDRGIGVAEDDLPRLFEPFFRTDRSRSRSTGGVGLGLALCQRVVAAHDGSVEAARRDGGGMVVRFQLPAQPAQRPDED